MKRVVVSGMGVVAPNGIGLKEFEHSLRWGRSGIRLVPELKDMSFACLVGGIPPGINGQMNDYFDAERQLSINDNMTYASVAAIDAWRDAGFEVPSSESTPDWDTGAIIGTGVGGMETIVNKLVPSVQQGKIKRMGSSIVEQVMNSSVSAIVGGLLGLGNQVTSNSSACSTGNEAIIDAVARIRAGFAKRMLAGGSEGHSPYIWAGFDAMRVLCRKYNDAPETASRPLSASAAGFVPGSGAGILILEELESALERNARIYAEIIGGAVNCGGHRQGGSMTAPNPVSVARCIKAAIHEAGIDPREIDAINGHLTATFADPGEVHNWPKALGRGSDCFPFINATKSMVGHCLGAAGAIECTAVVLQLHKGFLHPSINCEDVHPDIEEFSDRIPRTCIDMPDLRIIAKAGFGFGDVNSCLIFKKWEGK
jgi:3-oxoacyl-(acyl-carrier-protein) synthase